MYEDVNRLRAEARGAGPRDPDSMRRAILLATSPLDQAEEDIGAQQIIPGMLNREQAAGVAEQVARYAPTVGTLGGGIIGGIAGGALGATGAGLLTSATGPGAIGAAIGGGLTGAGAGAGLGSAIGGGLGSLVGMGAQGYADQYAEDLDRQRLEEDARRAQLLQLLAMAGD